MNLISVKYLKLKHKKSEVIKLRFLSVEIQLHLFTCLNAIPHLIIFLHNPVNVYSQKSDDTLLE